MKYDGLSKVIARSRRVAALTGAGISAESGVPTFRGEDGLWRNYRAEELATPSAFERDPVLVWEWYQWRRGLISECHPNPAHNTLVEMEEIFPEFTLISQNVDGLHGLAGSKNVKNLHGSIFTVRCTECGKEYEDRTHPLPEIPPRCECEGLLRPAVIWFGESLDPGVLIDSRSAASRCDTMFVVGTSAVVQPAASLPLIAKENGALVIEINLQRTPVSGIADLTCLGKAGEELPKIWNEIREYLDQ